MQIVFEPYAPDELKKVVHEGVTLHNVAATGMSEHYPVTFFLKADSGEIQGGLLGHIWGGWLEIHLVWIAHPLRGQNHGSALLAEAEKLAIARGCHSAYLDTFSFQAPEFYQKQGYQVYGVLEDCPTGHRRLYLRKSLVPRDSAGQ
jgi:GNAT superfamily N-acetyltransferase